MKFIVFRDVNGDWRFRLVAKNNKIIATGEAYTQRAGVLKTIKNIKAECAWYDIPVIEKKDKETNYLT